MSPPLVNYFNFAEVSDFCKLTLGNRGLFNLYCLMHAADSETTKVCLLTCGLAVAADYLCDSKLCPNSVLLLLAVKHLGHRNTTQAGYGIGVAHLGESGDGSLYKVVRV